MRRLISSGGTIFPIFGGFWAGPLTGVARLLVKHVTFLQLTHQGKATRTMHEKKRNALSAPVLLDRLPSAAHWTDNCGEGLAGGLILVKMLKYNMRPLTMFRPCLWCRFYNHGVP
jgi:hypothetical protein